MCCPHWQPLGSCALTASPIVSLIHILRQGLAPTPITLRHPRVKAWFCLALVWAVALAVIMVSQRWGEPYQIPDDARQHIFWMQRFVDPALFKDDLIADYYASVSPQGFVALYRIAALLGISPLLLNQLLPGGLIIGTALLAFLTGLELCALPAAAFASSILMLQSGDLTVNIASGTARAFVYLLLLLFLYGWLRRSLWLTGLAIALQGLIHPQTLLISTGLLVFGAIARREGRWCVAASPELQRLTLGGVLIAAVAIAYYGFSSSGFGPTITRTAALDMVEFHRSGRSLFFRPDVADFLLAGRSGLGLDIVFTPGTNVLALTVPVLLAFPKQLPLAQTTQAGIRLLLGLVGVPLFWFFTAHIFLFQLHLPSRYTTRYWMVAAALGAGMALVIIVDALLAHTATQLQTPRGSARLLNWISAGLAGGGATILTLVLVLYPLTLSGFPPTSLLSGKQGELYAFFATQPPDSVIASLAPEVNNLPSFAQRSILVGSETAIPYHTGYYRQIQQRAKDLIRAQYSPDPPVVKAFIERYGITHWLLAANGLRFPTLQNHRWAQQFQPEADAAGAVFVTGQTPILATVGDRCVTFQSQDYRVLDAQCLLTVL